jgi:membrane fusion protein (multidrug efflux system)
VATPFSRTLRSLRAERSRSFLIGVTVVAILLSLWSAWFFLARVNLHEVSARGRLEVDRAPHPVASESVARVVEVRFELGDEVEAGDVLVVLDARAEQARLDEERARLAAYEVERQAVQSWIEAEREAIERAREALAARLEEARALQDETELAATLAEEEAARLERVEESGLSELEILRARTEAARKRAAARVAALAALRIEQEHREREGDRVAHLEELRREAAQLDGSVATTIEAIRRLEEEIERRIVRAPVDGTIGEVTDVRAGSVVVEGQRIASVVPHGELRAVAEFAPQDALGRIRTGQPARIRFVGFPWSQYGTVSATVSGVGSEARDGAVRVELSLPPDPETSIPLQHGLPVSVEVEVETLSPAELVLRAAGRLVASAGEAR